MRLVADTPDDYKKMSRIQKQITQLFKLEKEKDPQSLMTKTYKRFINTSIEKAYERPGESAKVANDTTIYDTQDPAMYIAYIVYAAVNRKKVAIEYKSGKGDISTRLIEPHGWRNNQVVAWCHERGAWRQFKPSMIQRLAVTNEGFDREEEVTITAEDATVMAHLIAG